MAIIILAFAKSVTRYHKALQDVNWEFGILSNIYVAFVAEITHNERKKDGT